MAKSNRTFAPTCFRFEGNLFVSRFYDGKMFCQTPAMLFTKGKEHLFSEGKVEKKTSLEVVTFGHVCTPSIELLSILLPINFN